MLLVLVDWFDDVPEEAVAAVALVVVGLDVVEAVVSTVIINF